MAIESEIQVLKSVVNKLDTSLEKISEVSNNIGRLLAVHDERISQLEKTSDKRSEDIKELHSRITTQTREILDKIEDLERCLETKLRENVEATKDLKTEIQTDIKEIDNRVLVIERWRWYVLGIVATLGYILGNSKLGTFLTFLK